MKPRTFLLLTALPLASMAGDIEPGNFSAEDFATWEASGTAFSKGPASGEAIARLEIENAPDDALASSELEGDPPRGTLGSPTFTIGRNFISYHIAGGDYERHTCLNLLIDGKIVRSATGRNSDRLHQASWDVSPFRGKQARIEIVDRASGRWGHINVDNIVQTDAPAVYPVSAEPLYQEALRPQFHFTARQWAMNRLNPGMRQEGWINDLNGLIYYEGEYHLFAQRWHKCWLHAVSKDLVHWQELEPAFWEDELESGVQSGTCVIDYKNSSGLSPDPAIPPMIAFWSAADNRSQCISYSLDRGRSWQHYEKNPIMEFAERDPKVFWHEPGKHWVMFLYGNGRYHILTSQNLLEWKDEKKPVSQSFECPDFFELPLQGDPQTRKWVLVQGDGKYTLGSFNGTEFKPESERLVADINGHGFYATQSWANTETGDGRRIQAAWIRGSNFPDMPFNQQISFPCELTLHKTPAGLRIFRKPVQEIEKLYQSSLTLDPQTLEPDKPLVIAPEGELFRIQAEVDIPQGSRLKFNLRGVPLLLTPKSIQIGETRGEAIGSVRSVEILLDRASVEAFVNDGEISSTNFVLPVRPGLSVVAEGGPATIRSMKVHPLKSAWKGGGNDE